MESKTLTRACVYWRELESEVQTILDLPDAKSRTKESNGQAVENRVRTGVWKGCCALCSKMGFDTDEGRFDLRNQDFDAMNTSSFRSGCIVSVRNILVHHVP